MESTGSPSHFLDDGNIPAGRAMRVVFLLPDGFKLGGVPRWSIQQAVALRARGFRVTIVSHLGRNTPIEYEGLDQCELVACPEGLGTWRPSEREVGELADFYRQFLPALFVPNYSTGTFAACALLKSTDPDVTRVLGFCHSDEPAYYRWLRYYSPMLDWVVAVSRATFSRIQDAGYIASENLALRQYGVRVPREPKTEASLPDSPIVLAYAGRLVERQKRVSRLVRLVKALDRREVRYRLVIAGDGPARFGLESAMTKAARTGNVEFVGPCPRKQMPSFWRSIDISLLVSDFEGTSIAMLESMGAGCVPIVPKVSGTEGVISHGENGWIYPRGDVDACADFIEEASRDRGRLHAMGAAARAYVEEHSSEADYADWLAQEMRRVMDAPSRGWPAGKHDRMWQDRCNALQVDMKLRAWGRRVMRATSLDTPAFKKMLGRDPHGPWFK